MFYTMCMKCGEQRSLGTGPSCKCSPQDDVITLRDYFAGMAMQGLLSNPKLQAQILKTGGAEGGWIESSAYGWADGMLKQRGVRLAHD